MSNVTEIKACKECNERKPLHDFVVSATCKNGRANLCKSCKNASSRKSYRENQAQWYLRDWRNSLKRKYNITEEEYQVMSASQNHVCKICKKKNMRSDKGEIRLAVDHCHETGKVRGLLCDSCNVALGKFCDNPDLVEEALKYLRDNIE